MRSDRCRRNPQPPDDASGLAAIRASGGIIHLTGFDHLHALDSTPAYVA
jgi:hypothetical protein